MVKQSTTYRVHWVLLSAERSSEDLVRSIGVAPDRRWEKGAPRDARSPTANLNPFSGVWYESRLPPDADVEDHIGDLLARLDPAADRIARLAESDTVTRNRFTIGIFEEESDNSSVLITNGQLAFIERLGAELYIDSYWRLGDAAEV